MRGAHSHLGHWPGQDSSARSSLESPAACFWNALLGIQRAGHPPWELERCAINLRSTPKMPSFWLKSYYRTTYDIIISYYLYCHTTAVLLNLKPPVRVTSHALKGLRAFPGCEAEKLPTVWFCLVGINLFHLSVNKVFLIVMAFFEMHIKSDELDCIPDVTKCRERNGQISNKNLFKSVHYPQGPTIEANTRMSLR